MNDTIAAISTALGVGAISIIRISGPDAIKIAGSIFRGNDLDQVDSHTINYGHVFDQDKVIDEVLVSVMRAPKTFTMEDIIEINCHGGIASTKRVLELVLMNGARLAEPGEFTKRAFLNGRIDLIEAEGIMDIINAKTEEARSLAINQLDGKVSGMIKNLRQKILEILANIEVNIDYPEYEDIEVMTNELLLPKINEVNLELEKILADSDSGKLIKEGIDTAIIGRPNVGKSSLLNRLLNEEKAIVTEIAGTTRDTVEGKLNLNGVIINFIDTAGIRKTEDIVEKIGVNKSIDLISRADLILYVLNNNEELSTDDYEILNKIKNKNHIIIVNKIDLETKLEINKLNSEKTIFISATNNRGLDDLKHKIIELYDLDKIHTSDLTYLTNANSIALVKKSLNILQDVVKSIKNNVPVDIIELDIKQVWDNLGEITGETYQEALIDQLFSQFCLGK